jgi:hypothetical protein
MPWVQTTIIQNHKTVDIVLGWEEIRDETRKDKIR